MTSTLPEPQSWLFLRVWKGGKRLSPRYSHFDVAQSQAALSRDILAAQGEPCYCHVMPSLSPPEIVVIGGPAGTPPAIS